MKTIARTLISTLVPAFFALNALAATTTTSADGAAQARPPAPPVAEVDRHCTDKCKNSGDAEAYEGCMIECRKNWKKKTTAGSGTSGSEVKPSIAADH